MGKHLSLDETALSHGELYTILTNKEAKGKQGAIVAIVAGTASEFVKKHFQKLPLRLRNKVEEITLDMAGNMNLIAKSCFPNGLSNIELVSLQNTRNVPSNAKMRLYLLNRLSFRFQDRE